MKNLKHYIAVIVLIILATVGLYFLFANMFSLPPAASAEAGPIDVMFDVHFWMIAFLFALIMVIMLYSAFAFRRRPGDETDAPHVHGSTILEIAWTVIPTLTVIGFGIWAVGVLNDLIAPKANELTISVTSRQWSWSFQYPEQNNIRSSVLNLPVNQPVLLEMNAQDVIHSFWVPEFRVKQDLVPGQTTHLRFTPTQVGTYKVRCAEICGTGHAGMSAVVEVMSAEAFQEFIDNPPPDPQDPLLSEAERGAIWASNDYFACAGCHSTDGSVLVGPTWLGLYGREEQLEDGTTVVADEEYIHNSIIDPNSQIVSGFAPGQMPANYEERFAIHESELGANTDTDPANDVDIIEDIMAYIQTLEE
jgi:cytochrome c oxidase subunit 2